MNAHARSDGAVAHPLEAVAGEQSKRDNEEIREIREAVIGTWPHKHESGLAYQRRIREAWD